MDINQSLGFEDVTFEKNVNSVNATSAMLNSEFDVGNSLSFSYVHATNAKVETDGLNNYLVGSSTGVTLGDTQAQKSCFFQLKDTQTRLATTDWTIAFDLCVPGITNDNGTPDDTTDDTVYKYSSYTVSLFGLTTDKPFIGDPKNGKYQNIWVVDNNGNLKYSAAQDSTGITLKQGQWYRLFASYDAETQQVTTAVLGKDEGYKKIATFGYAVDKTATETFFRFGFGWEAGQWCKFHFDNIALTTGNDGVNIDVDFEEGTVGDQYIPSDVSLGGADATGSVNNGTFNKAPWSNSLRYYDDGTGNTYLGSSFGTGSNYLWIRDQTLKTLTQKFVVSCDFKINQTAIAYTAFSWRLGNEKSENVPLFIIMADQTLNIRPKLKGDKYDYKSSALEDGKWYNIAAIIDPVGKVAEFYIGGLDTKPVYTTTFDYDFSAATVSAFSFGPGSGKITVNGAEVNDHLGYDNIRIYTLDETIEEATPPSDINMSTLGADGVILETDFESFEASTAMSSEAWNQIAPFGVTANDGIIVEANGNKHFQPATGSGATSFNISSFKASPYLDGVIAIESDFAFGNNSSNSGNLVIAALKRVGVDNKAINVPLLTADKNGKLTVVQHATDYTLPSETVRIRLELCYAFHTVNLYIDGKSIATAIPLKVDTTLQISQGTFTDSFGNEHKIPYTGYVYNFAFDNNGLQIKDQNGRNTYVPHYYENYGYSETFSYIKDSIDMFGASAGEAWSFAMDNLKIYLDKDADVYFNDFSSWASGIAATGEGSLKTGSAVAIKNGKYIDNNGNRALTSVSPGATKGNNVSFFIDDTLDFLQGKSFVFELDVKYNPNFQYLSFIEESDGSDATVTGASFFTSLKWEHTIRMFMDGAISIKSSGAVDGRFKDNEWSKLQFLCISVGAGVNHTVYTFLDGALIGGTSSINPSNILRFAIEKYSYDVQIDNIRIYLSDKPDSFENVITGALDGKSLFSLEVSDREALEKLMANEKSGLIWNFKDFNATSNNINEATTSVLLDKGDFVRVVHQNLKDSSPYNITIDKAALDGHKQYVFETEFRYTCPTGFELEVISSIDKATQSKDKLVYVLGTTREIVFNRNGFTYNLTDASGNKLYAENVTDDATAFTKIAVIVDEAANNYSIYVNDSVAYYSYGDALTTATEIDIDKNEIFDPSLPIGITASTISLLNLSTSTSADALLDIKSANFYVLRTGVAPYITHTQSKIEADKCDVRFIAPIDMLYGKEVGFEVTTNIQGSNVITRAGNEVYSSVRALDTETGVERDFLAEEFDGTYLAVITVNGASVVDTVEYTVRPFIVIGGSKIYNESFTVTYSDGKVVTE